MPAPENSPMANDLWDRLRSIAEWDSARAERLKRPHPISLRLYLVGGHFIDDCHLSDGLNSLDDESIDVTADEDEPRSWWIVPLSAIAAIHATYPEDPHPETEADPEKPRGRIEPAPEPDARGLPGTRAHTERTDDE